MEGSGERRERLEPVGGSYVERVLRSDLRTISRNKTKPNMERAVESEVLGKVKQFLPRIEKANLDLEEAIRREGSSKYQVDDVEDEDCRHIEMDLGLGVVELKDEAAEKAAERIMSSGGGLGAVIESYDGGEGSSESEEEEEESRKEDGTSGRKPMITEIS